MTDAIYKYYTSIQASITAKELASIPQDRYDDIEQLAYADVKANRKARTKGTFKSDAEYKLYLLDLVDFACKEKNGISVILGAE